MKKYAFILLCLVACGDDLPLVDVPEDPAPVEPVAPVVTVEVFNYMDIRLPIREPPRPDAGTVADAGGKYPYADCERHRKAQGHGKGLGKSCD